jgi:hypothetical protein
VNPLDAAPLTCACVTTYKAVKLSGARPAVRHEVPYVLRTKVAVFVAESLGDRTLLHPKRGALLGVSSVQQRIFSPTD